MLVVPFLIYRLMSLGYGLLDEAAGGVNLLHLRHVSQSSGVCQHVVVVGRITLTTAL